MANLVAKDVEIANGVVHEIRVYMYNPPPNEA